MPAAAQTQPEADEAEARVLEFGVELRARHGMTPREPQKGAAPRAAALDTLELARARAEALTALIQWNPDRAIAVAFSQETIRELRARSPQIAPSLEERGSWQGAATMYIADDVERRRAIEFHVLDTPEGSIEAYGIPRRAWNRNGDRVAVSGVAVRGRVAVQAARLVEPVVAAAPSSPYIYDTASNCDPTGEQKTAVFLITRPGEKKPFTVETIREFVFGPERSLDRYVRTVSSGKAWLSGEVFEVEIARWQEPWPSYESFEELAAAAGLQDFEQFNRYAAIGYRLTASPNIAGVSSLGCWESSYRASYLYSNIYDQIHGGELQTDAMLDRLSELLIHEYGHSLALGHSRSLLADGETLEAAPDGMTIREYGDWYDPMGNGADSKFFNARQLLGLGWLDPDDVITVEREGTFTVKLLDDGSPADSPSVLRILRRAGTDEWLWMEALSRSSALDQYGFKGVWKPVVREVSGALVRVENEELRSSRPESTHFLDFSPDDEHFHNYELPIGQTWNDPYSSLSLTVESISPAGMTVRVERAADCVRSVSPNAYAHTYLPQEGVFEVNAPADCAWEAKSFSDWLEIDPAHASGIGPGRVAYSLHQNAESILSHSRVGVALVGRQSFVAVQNPYPRTFVDIAELSPGHGSGMSQTFRVVASAPNKALAPGVFLTFRDKNNEDVCQWAFKPKDSSFGASFYPNSWGCEVDLSRSRVTFEDGKMVIDFHIVFSENARGLLQVYAEIYSIDGNWWTRIGSKQGSWTVGEPPDNKPPVIERLNISSTPYFYIRARDPDGWLNIADVSLDIRSADESKQCDVTYNLAEERVTLRGASGVQRATLDGGPLENEYCTVIPSRVDVYRYKETVRIEFSGAIYFSRAFAGPLTVRAKVLDHGGMAVEANRDFKYSYPEFGPRTLPGFVSPASGSGDSQRFEWTLLHPEDGGDAGYGALEFRSASENAYCGVRVSGNSVSLSRYLYDGDGETEDYSSSDYIRIGGTNAFLENDLCSIDVSGMESSIAGNARSLSALIGFKPAFAGPFAVTIQTTGSGIVRGVWHPGDPGGGPWIVEPVNAASSTYSYRWISPGEVVAIFGSGLGPETTVEARADGGGDIPKELAGTRVLFDGRPVPLLSVSAMRVEAVTPFSAATGWGKWRVERNGVSSNSVDMYSDETNPGLFSLDGSGTGRVLAGHHGDGSRNSPQNPVEKGSVVVLYATGLGLTDPPAIAGRTVAADAPPTVRAPISVIVGNRAAEVLYAGGAAGQAAGIAQVNVRIGESTPGGAHIPIRLIAGDRMTRQPLTIAVEASDTVTAPPSRPGICASGTVVAPGGSCRIQTSNGRNAATFSVREDGYGCIAFICAGSGLSLDNITINGFRITLHADRNANGAWTISRVSAT